MVQSNSLSLSHVRPTHFVSVTLGAHQKDESIFGELVKQSTYHHKSGTKVTVRAAMLLSVSIMVSPFKEGSPAKITRNTTDVLLRERRRRKNMRTMSIAWFKASYAWVLMHLWAVVVAIATWWKIPRS